MDDSGTLTMSGKELNRRQILGQVLESVREPWPSRGQRVPILVVFPVFSPQISESLAETSTPPTPPTAIESHRAETFWSKRETIRKKAR
jgi:hypothetical protein